MTGYTRLTLVGSTRRVDVVVPDDEPVGRLMPEALELAGEQIGSPAAERRLALLDGRLLEQDLSLGEAEVPDGAVLRIVALADAPPPPVVLDVTEETAQDLADRSWRWGPEPRRWLATALAAVATVAALAISAPLMGEGRNTVLLVIAGVLLVAGAVVGRLRSFVAGTTLVLSGAAAAGYAVAQRDLGALPSVAAAVAIVALTVLALGIGSSLGRGGVVGGVVGLVLLGCWVLLVNVLPGPQGLSCLSVLTVALLGLLPRLAAMSAGLTGLDDRRASNDQVRRRDVGTALRTTHRGLALATIAVASSALVAGVWLTRVGGVWPTTIAALIALVVAIRIRAFPLLVEVVALALALVGIGFALLLAWLQAAPQARGAVGLVVALIAVAAFALPLVDVTPQLRARGRVLGDRIEVLAVVAMVPVLVGVFGVYPRLLQSF